MKMEQPQPLQQSTEQETMEKPELSTSEPIQTSTLRTTKAESKSFKDPSLPKIW